MITKREFKRKLGDSRQETLASYHRYHAKVEREIAEGRKRLNAGPSPEIEVQLSDRGAYAEALRRRADLVAAGADEDELELTGDMLAESYPQHGSVGVSPVDSHTINLLRLGPGRHKAPAPTLSDAQRLYVSEKIGEDEGADTRAETRVARIIRMAVAALGRNPVLSSLTREDTRNMRNAMLGRAKSTDAQVSAASMKRELNVLKAVINFGKVEFGLPETFQNPFNRLDLGASAIRQHESDKRDPLPPEVLKEVRRRVLTGAGSSLVLIWRLVEGTGCRIAEVNSCGDPSFRRASTAQQVIQQRLKLFVDVLPSFGICAIACVHIFEVGPEAVAIDIRPNKGG